MSDAEVEIQFDPTLLFYCQQDNMYIGFGATPWLKPPPGHTYEWLASHCWLCGRSKKEIADDQLSRI